MTRVESIIVLKRCAYVPVYDSLKWHWTKYCKCATIPILNQLKSPSSLRLKYPVKLISHHT